MNSPAAALTPSAAQDDASLVSALAAVVGAAQVRSDAPTLALFGEDIAGPGAAMPACVVAPGSVEELSRVLAAASIARRAVAPRGAGMSYTGGYVSALPGTVALDLSRLNRVLEINAQDMTVTVQAGVSWSQLLAALAPQGLRTPFWGPMSGLTSSVGGGVSQLNAMLGAGQHGTSSESVVALTVVLADGRVLRTGARGTAGAQPFYRHYGPDLAGLFCGDCGTLGVKAEITLRLIKAPPHEGCASFSFGSGVALLQAMAALARAGLASEMCAFDPGLTRVRMQRESLAGDVRRLAAVVGRQKSLVKGLMDAGRIALAGRDFIAEGDYPLHLIAEGRCAAAVEHDLAEARRIAQEAGGHEIENSIAKLIRAQPFPPANSVLGPAGERWLPVHGVVPLSASPTVFAALQTVLAEMAPQFDSHRINTGCLFSSLSTNALVIEPVFYWPDARAAIHEAAITPEHLARLPVLPAGPQARAVVAEARRRLIAVFEAAGCGHFQIGRTYPYRASRDAASWSLLAAAKRELDPAGLMNPGVLGFDLPGRS